MSQQESFAKCSCQHCGGHIEYPIQGAGQNIACPHCGRQTLLPLIHTPPVEIGGGSAARKRIYTAFAIAAGATALACGAAYFLLFFNSSNPPPAKPGAPVQSAHAAPAPAPPAEPKPPPDPWHGLTAGRVTLEKSADGGLIYAVGTLKNDSQRQRFGVKVQIDVLDAQHNKLGSATDYTDVIDPGKEWKFRAMVTDRTASAAKLADVKEQ